MASTSAVRCTGSALRAAVIRAAVTGGLTLLAIVFGSAVANAATSSDAPSANTIANTLQTDMSDLVTSLLQGLGGHHHVGLPGGVSVIQPPADDGGSAAGTANPGGPPQSSSSGDGSSVSIGQGASGTGSDSGGDNTWTGSTTVTVPTKTTPQAPEPPPAVPPAPVHVAQSAPTPVSRDGGQQASKSTEPSMGSPTGVVPDLPRNPIELPLQQPASQPVSTPSTGGTASHDLGSANGIADITPPGTGFRPSPGSTTDEHSAKRVSDGVPGLPSTSPD
ncbi:hypothetical protein [Kutzneria sp. NPDC052558]|uniref:hypothetical protein n=1 Tax=Kutzneria sp. NPDC052558 TaxID=3364121 RepID=UPI0037C6FA9A